MKLFVWCEPYKVPYGSSMFFAVAKTEEDARRIAKSATAWSFGEFQQWRSSAVELGKPTRVVDVGDGIGEWHEWSE